MNMMPGCVQVIAELRSSSTYLAKVQADVEAWGPDVQAWANEVCVSVCRCVCVSNAKALL